MTPGQCLMGWGEENGSLRRVSPFFQKDKKDLGGFHNPYLLTITNQINFHTFTIIANFSTPY
jgi:hypothetical protein